MQNKTWFKLYRGWQNNPMFRTDKDKLNWLWLIENAVIKELTVSVNNKPVKVYRGQLCYSISFLSKAWSTTPSYVRHFLKHLKLWQAINMESDKGQTLITICNYNKYQDKETVNDKGYVENSTRQRQGNDNNTKKDKELKNKEVITPNPFDADFEIVWQEYKPYEMGTKGNKKTSLKSYITARKKTDHETIRNGVTRYIQHCHATQCKTKHFSTWLNQEGWADEYSTPQNKKSSYLDSLANASRTVQADMEADFDQW